LLIVGELAKERLRAGQVLEAAQEPGFEQGGFQVIRRGAQTIFDQRLGLRNAVAPFVKHRQFQLGVGDFLGRGEDALKTVNGLLRPKDHAVALAGQVQQLWVARTQFCQPIEQRLGPGDLESRAEGPAGIHERDEVLGVFGHRPVEQDQGFIEVVHLPQRSGLAQFRHIHAEAGNDHGPLLCPEDGLFGAKRLIPVFGHVDQGTRALRPDQSRRTSQLEQKSAGPYAHGRTTEFFR